MDNFETALADFVIYANKLQNERNGVKTHRIEIDRGRKNLKLVRVGVDNGDRSAYCFVEIATGNILKAASWKAPAKGVRGSIFTPYEYGVTAYGAVYNR